MSAPSMAAGIKLFNAGRYFDAHEQWEFLWSAASGESKDRLQGLIQAAVALHHYTRKNGAGARYLLEQAKVRLARGFPQGVAGDSAAFLADLELYVSGLKPVPPRLAAS